MSPDDRAGPLEPGRPSPQRRSAAARFLGAGARGADRLASATGVDQALEDAMEEAIVRALRSPAVERAVIRIIERNAVQDAVARTLTSEEIAEAVAGALDTEVADRVWVEILASNKAQMLVERIAAAPEVRAAIAEQGVGLLTDLGRRLTAVTERLDDALERVTHVLRPGREAEETNEVGLVTRLAAAALDVGIAAITLSIASGLFASVIPFVGADSLSTTGAVVAGVLGFLTAGAIVVAFWSLVGQTPGMRLLSIRLDVDGSREVGLRRAMRRVLALPVSLLAAGMGFFAILFSPTRQGWHDHFAGTRVVYDTSRDVAPWAKLGDDGRSEANKRSIRSGT
jgi:uncharacterized RDD family membrane protein YckC